MDLTRKSIRVGIAAAICMLASNMLKLKFPFFTLLPAVMPISTFFGETIKFGLNRIIGTSIGVVIGVMLAYIQTENILLIGIGVMILIYVCSYLKWDSTTSIACLVFLSIMVSVKESAFSYSAHRLLDTFIGIAITTIVNLYVFNPDIKELLKIQAKEIQADLLNIANNKNFYENNNELNNIESKIKSMKEKFKIYTESVNVRPKLTQLHNELKNMIYILCIAFDQIKMINYINSLEQDNNNYNNIEFNLNNANVLIDFHKNIFFCEMKNLNRVMDNLPTVQQRN